MNKDEVTTEILRNLLLEIKSGDSDHGLSLAQMMLSEGPSFKPEVLIEVIEGVINLAVLAGSKDSKSYLESKWPILKASHLRRLSRKE